MRHLHVPEEEVALAILNALDQAGFHLVAREQQPPMGRGF